MIPKKKVERRVEPQYEAISELLQVLQADLPLSMLIKHVNYS